jgi:hypothetical protein
MHVGRRANDVHKILVIADEGVKIQDYKALSEYVFKN